MEEADVVGLAPGGGSGSRRWRVCAATGVVTLVASVLVWMAPAGAHTPHDNIPVVAVSPDFETTGTVYTISRARVLRSVDGGDTWTRLQRGLEIRRGPSDLAVASSDPSVLYLTTRGDGVFRSSERGERWTKLGAHPVANLVDVVVSPLSADTAATIAADEGSPVHLTTDGGRSWSELDVPHPAVSVALTTDPGTIVAGGAGGMISLSIDGGATWERSSTPDGAGQVHDLAPSPTFASDDRIYAATGGGGIWVSTDRGATFEEIDGPAMDVVDLLVTGADKGQPTLWATTQHDGILRSTDGETWIESGDGLTTDEMADRIGALDFVGLGAVATGTDPTMFAATFDGLFRSPEGDGSWEYLDTQVPTNVAGIAVSPSYADDRTVVVATYINGAQLSSDGGQSWESINDGLATEFEWRRREDYVARMMGIAFYPTFARDQKLFAGLRGYYLESDDAGGSWEAHVPEPIAASDDFPADYFLPAFSTTFAEDQTLLLGTDTGRVLRFDGDPQGIEQIGDSGSEFTALAISDSFVDDGLALGGTPEGPIRSEDGGRTWLAAGALSQPVTSLTLSDAYSRDGTAILGTKSGLYLSRDGGRGWERIDDEDLGERPNIEAAVLSPDFSRDGTALVSVAGRGLFRSDDGARTFEPIAPQLIEDHVVFNSFYLPTTEPIVFSPTFGEDRTVFGIAEDVVYRSEDAGDTWESSRLEATTHDPESDPRIELLRSVRPDTGPALASPGAWAFDTQIGALSARRVAAAAGVALAAFAAMTLVHRDPQRSSSGPGLLTRALCPSIGVRVAVSAAAFVVALLVLAV